MKLDLISAEDVGQAHFDSGVGPKAPGAGLRTVPEVWVPGARRDKLVTVLGAWLSSFLQESVGIVVCGRREKGLRLVDMMNIHAEYRPRGKFRPRRQLQGFTGNAIERDCSVKNVSDAAWASCAKVG